MRRFRRGGGEKSWKTFWLYASVVVFLIVASLTVKAIAIWEKNKFDSQQHFVLAVEQEGNVAGLISLQPANKLVSILHIKGDSLHTSSLGETLGIIPDSVIDIAMSDNVDEMLTPLLLGKVKSDLTIFDVVRLMLLVKSTSSDNKLVKELTLPQQDSDIDKIMTSFFVDQKLYSEGEDIYIVNASGLPGMAKKLERIISNLGGNVVRTSTAPIVESSSKIQYSGEITYTVKRLHRLFEFSPVMKNDNSGIVIIIGEDSNKKF